MNGSCGNGSEIPSTNAYRYGRGLSLRAAWKDTHLTVVRCGVTTKREPVLPEILVSAFERFAYCVADGSSEGWAATTAEGPQMSGEPDLAARRWSSGWASAFQADDAGSTPARRSVPLPTSHQPRQRYAVEKPGLAPIDIWPNQSGCRVSRCAAFDGLDRLGHQALVGWH